MLTNIKIKNIRIFITSNVVMVTDEEQEERIQKKKEGVQDEN